MSIDSGVRVGKYEVGPKLGQGGFGILHVARDHELGRDIAIKFLRPEHAFKPTVVQRFLQEARAAARINHPGIVTVFESGIVGGTNTRADGTVYIAMELLAGETLSARIKQLRRMPTPLAMNYARQLASALGAAHQAGIIHRDLKPANVFLVPDPAVVGGERVKVLDFGIAKLADDFGGNMQTHSMLMLGTPMYMSPEQCRSSAKVDARSDIYSLGCILFEMLCGQPPFGGDSGELIAKHQLVDPPTLRSLRGEAPAALDRLVMSMLAKSPDERPQTMAQVEDALAAIDTGTTPAETMEDGPNRVQAPRLRARLPIVVGATGAIALGIGVGLFSMCGHDKTPPAPQAQATSDAAVTIAVAPVEPASPVIDAAAAEAAGPAINVECLTYQADRKWAELSTCADRLAPFNKQTAETYKATAQLETTAEHEILAIEEAIDKKDKERAKKILTKVDERSVYRKRAEEEVEKGAKVAETTGGATTPEICNGDALKDKGMEDVNMGKHAAALAQFESSLRCKPDPYVLSLAFMAACNSQNEAKARLYYKKLSPAQRDKLSIMCVRNKTRFE